MPDIHDPEVEVSTVQRVAVAALWAFLLSPVLLQPFLGGGRGRLDFLYLFSVVPSLLWATALHLSVRRPFVLHLLLAPFYLTTTIDLFLMGAFGSRLSSGYVSIALTDYTDTSEFFLSYARPLGLAAAALAVVYLPGLYGIRHLRKSRSPRLAALAGVLLLIVYAGVAGRGLWHGGVTAQRSALDMVGKEMSAPFGVVFQTGLALHLQEESSDLRARRAQYSFGATKPVSNADEVYVWVIGESSRPQDWSLFGYGRDTTPKMLATPGIVKFNNMLSTAPHTAYAVPSMLSLQPITRWPSIISEKSIVGAFNEVGFKTYWLSAQEADSWAGLIPQLAAEAGRRRYYDRAFDGAMLDEFRAILDQTPHPGKVLIVLHTKGSHFEYSRRYPPEFARFSTPGGSRRDELVDSYDNSILYTDWFLGEVISALAKRNARSVLIYASDHGENLLDDDQHLFGHAIGNRYDLPTASFMWLSNGMREVKHAQVLNAERNAMQPLSLSNLPHSLLDLADIDAKDLDRRMSIFSPTFEPQPRSFIVRGNLRHETPDLNAPQ